MKTFNHFSKGSGLLIRVLPLLLLYFTGCTKQDIAPVGVNENLNEMSPKCIVIQKGPIQLKGITGFGFYSAKEHKVLADPYVNSVECTAELTFRDKQNFVLHTKEFAFGIMYREVSFNGKMTPSGELKFSWPMIFKEFNFETNELEVKDVGVLPEIRLHTGFVLFGPGINKNTLDYKGYFRKNKFFADTHFRGIQKVPGITMINFLIDLEVSK